MSVWVQHHSDVRLRLEIGKSCAQSLCTSDRGVEVVGRDVKVHHHLLCLSTRRPPWRSESGFVLKRQAGRSRGRLEFHPTRFVVETVPAQQSLIEVGEPLGIRTSEHGRGDVHRRCWVGHPFRMPWRVRATPPHPRVRKPLLRRVFPRPAGSSRCCRLVRATSATGPGATRAQ
jgi:hypothetical protein